ncbi:MAG: DUF3332 family protein [Candidatus Brocadiia bacterium]
MKKESKKESGTGALSVLRNRRAWVISIILVAMGPFVFGGCYGAFPLTKTIYKLNEDISDNSLVQQVTFWVFVIVPVYEVGMLADAIVFNLVDYWTGDNLLAVGPTMDSDGNLVCLTPAANGREAVLTVSRDGRVIAQESFVKVSDATFEVRDAHGNLHGKVLKAPDGTISLTDSNGTVVRTLPAEALPTR